MKKLKTVTLITLLIVGFTATASASVVGFTWSTSGEFTGTHPGLTFSGAPSTSGTSDAAGNLTINNLGSFTLSAPSSDTGTGTHTFRLLIDFTAPTGVADPAFYGTVAIDANYTWGLGNDSADVTFGPAQTVAFTGGSFVLAVDPVHLQTTILGIFPDTEMITGRITQATTVTSNPEPLSIFLLGTVIAGLTLVARKKMIRV